MYYLITRQTGTIYSSYIESLSVWNIFNVVFKYINTHSFHKKTNNAAFFWGHYLPLTFNLSVSSISPILFQTFCGVIIKIQI